METIEDFQGSFWPRLHFDVSRRDLSAVHETLTSNRVNINHQSQNKAVPKVTALHVAVWTKDEEMVQLLLSQAQIDVNRQDQFGFSALHYAVFARSLESMKLLLEAGAQAGLASENGTTPVELAKHLGYVELMDALASREKLEKDETLPAFRDWLTNVGAGEFLQPFLQAGYDLPFIAKNGLTDADLDCVGVPLKKLGIRRKLMALHNLEKYYENNDGEDEDSEEEEGEEEEEDEEEGGED